MNRIQIHTELDIKSILQQLKTSDLKELLREIPSIIQARQEASKQAREKVLLLQLNEECTLSASHWKRFWILTDKQSANTLSEEEEQELLELIQQEEILRLKRINILGELTELRGVSIMQLTTDLGIKPAARA